MGSGDKGEFLEQCDVGLGLKMQGSDCKRMTLMPHQYSCHYQCDGGGGGGGGGGAGDGGAIYCSASNLVASMSDIYDVVGAGGGGAVPRTLHPFAADTSFFKSAAAAAAAAAAAGGAGGMAASLRIPFTAAQWQELEWQTMIYKYMMASVPVPPELLIPISRSLCDMTPSHSNQFLDLPCPNNSDREPWRCRRTDGKKWRCSRDVAPDQKYCERHTHKGRPRSRKPVELHSELISNSATNKLPLNLPAEAAKSYQGKPHLTNRTEGRHATALPSVGSAPPPPPPPPYGQARCSDWFAKGGETAQQQWQNLMLFQSKVEGPKRTSSSASGSYSGSGVPLHQQRGSLLSPKLASFQHPNLSHGGTGTARDFIDAWSSGERVADGELHEVCNYEFPVSSRGKLPVSSLTLSMCGGNGSNEQEDEEDNSGSSRNLHGGGELSFKSQTLNWMNPARWMSSPPGGPLAEALCLGMANTVKPPPDAAQVHGGSSATTTSSSSSSKSSCGDASHGDGGLQI